MAKKNFYAKGSVLIEAQNCFECKTVLSIDGLAEKLLSNPEKDEIDAFYKSNKVMFFGAFVQIFLNKDAEFDFWKFLEEKINDDLVFQLIALYQVCGKKLVNPDEKRKCRRYMAWLIDMEETEFVHCLWGLTWWLEEYPEMIGWIKQTVSYYVSGNENAECFVQLFEAKKDLCEPDELLVRKICGLVENESSFVAATKTIFKLVAFRRTGDVPEFYRIALGRLIEQFGSSAKVFVVAEFFIGMEELPEKFRAEMFVQIMKKQTKRFSWMQLSFMLPDSGLSEAMQIWIEEQTDK